MSFSRHAFQNVGFQVGRDDAAPIWPGRHEPPDLSLLHELRRRPKPEEAPEQRVAVVRQDDGSQVFVSILGDVDEMVESYFREQGLVLLDVVKSEVNARLRAAQEAAIAQAKRRKKAIAALLLAAV